MKENDCPIKDCYCKCETKQELRDWTFRSIQKHLYEERQKGYANIDFRLFYEFVGNVIDGYAEYSMDMEK